ncbi:MAG TPA: hypothetical protein VNN62_11680 [Methylomirabilota bacterium]|jgi:hypothetical protein|nr:hypothetical protein [Methylomirabilota bacterium]
MAIDVLRHGVWHCHSSAMGPFAQFVEQVQQSQAGVTAYWRQGLQSLMRW